MKETLRSLHIGYYAYNEIVIYIAEICKKVEKLEICSGEVTDYSICEVFRKMKCLKVLDISRCMHFCGIALSELEEVGCKDLKKLTVSLLGYEMHKCCEKMNDFVPECVVEFKQYNSYIWYKLFCLDKKE